LAYLVSEKLKKLKKDGKYKGIILFIQDLFHLFAISSDIRVDVPCQVDSIEIWPSLLEEFLGF
jgi:hypothetical protein